MTVTACRSHRHPVKRQYEYVFSSERYAQDLQIEAGKLQLQADRIDFNVKEAEAVCGKDPNNVAYWRNSTNDVLKDATRLCNKFEEESKSKTCCCGTIPDPRFHYWFSKDAEIKIPPIRKLNGQAKIFQLSDYLLSNPAATNGIKPRKDDVFESRASIIQIVMDALADNKNSVVGIYGMGGVGKSTLLNDVKRKICEGKKFDWVIKADMRRDPDIKIIQGEIADALGLTSIKDKETIKGRAELLHRRLKQEIEKKKKKVLIILDDLWRVLDLKLVGIPCRFDNKVIGCKLLLTSRYRSVLQSDMGSDREIHLKGLKEDEARRLFESTVGGNGSNDKLTPPVEELLHKCAGLPFLIISLAKRLKRADLFQGMEIIRNIGKSEDEKFNEARNELLQSSYDRLDDEVRLFLQLCVVLRGSKPSLENLMKYVVNLGLLRDASPEEEARDKLSSLIRALEDYSLLSEDGEGEAHYVKIHHMVSEFVVSMGSIDHRLLVLKDE